MVLTWVPTLFLTAFACFCYLHGDVLISRVEGGFLVVAFKLYPDLDVPCLKRIELAPAD